MIDWKKVGAVAGMVCLLLVSAHSSVRAFEWEAEPPMLSGDPDWDKVKILWQDHADSKNLDEIIALLESLKDKYPDKIETYLCLAKAYDLHAWYVKKHKHDYYEKAETYAFKACEMDSCNSLAMHTLVDALAMNRDRQYIFEQYGDFFRTAAPFKTNNAEALPEMETYPQWSNFYALWQARADVEKAKGAASLAEEMALENPKDVLAQVWAARAYYFIGEVHTSLGEHDDKAIPNYKKGIFYAETAMKLNPKSQIANFWYLMNLARSIQFTNILNKFRCLMNLYHAIMLNLRENSGYMFFNSYNVLGTMITNGGWVTEKGMGLAGLRLDQVLNGLEISEMMYPDFYYISYCRADILSYKGKKDEALAILESLLARSPDVNEQIPENHSFQREARKLYDAIRHN